MKICILAGSPRKQGNTAKLLDVFMDECARLGAGQELFRLHDLRIGPCIACRACQADWSGFNCRFKDDAHTLAEAVLASDLLVFATPIYSWFCTPPMKALLDRFVYGLNKYYGEEKGPSLWAGKSAAIISTCGYNPERGADLFEEALRRYCKHSGLRYREMLVERDPGYKGTFMSEDKAERARLFARRVLAASGTGQPL